MYVQCEAFLRSYDSSILALMDAARAMRRKNRKRFQRWAKEHNLDQDDIGVNVDKLVVKFKIMIGLMQIIGSFTPNSAAAERVFSMLNMMFGDTQMSALVDMIQTALMLRYNKRTVG